MAEVSITVTYGDKCLSLSQTVSETLRQYGNLNLTIDLLDRVHKDIRAALLVQMKSLHDGGGE